MEELDIVTLDNNKDYVIAKMLDYKGKKYFLLVEVDKDENLLDDKIILELNSINRSNELKTIDNNLTYKIISEKFAKLLLEDIK